MITLIALMLLAHAEAPSKNEPAMFVDKTRGFSYEFGTLEDCEAALKFVAENPELADDEIYCLVAKGEDNAPSE